MLLLMLLLPRTNDAHYPQNDASHRFFTRHRAKKRILLGHTGDAREDLRFPRRVHLDDEIQSLWPTCCVCCARKVDAKAFERCFIAKDLSRSGAGKQHQHQRQQQSHAPPEYVRLANHITSHYQHHHPHQQHHQHRPTFILSAILPTTDRHRFSKNASDSSKDLCACCKSAAACCCCKAS
jgi:hypothetical protein